MRIIPAIDIINGKCVRLTQGDYNRKKIYNENPLEVARMFEDAGLEYLHVVDLDGAKSKEIVNYRILESIANRTRLKVDFGGGIKSKKDVRIAFDSGAQQITIGSLSAKNPELFIEILNEYGSDKIILGADAMNEKIAINGWQENTSINVLDFINDKRKRGVKNIICTDISKDGMLEGPSFILYQKILDNNSEVNLIASGGIRNQSDVLQLLELGCEGAIIGKAIYENRISLKELSDFSMSGVSKSSN